MHHVRTGGVRTLNLDPVSDPCMITLESIHSRTGHQSIDR